MLSRTDYSKQSGRQRLPPVIIRLIIIMLSAGVMAAGMSWLDWYRNPGSLFYRAGKTDWSMVWDTWVSWFAPLLVCGLVSMLVIPALCRLWRKSQKIPTERG